MKYLIISLTLITISCSSDNQIKVKQLNAIKIEQNMFQFYIELSNNQIILCQGMKISEISLVTCDINK